MKTLEFIYDHSLGYVVAFFAGIAFWVYLAFTETEEDVLQNFMDDYGEDEGYRLYKLEGGRL